MPKVIKKQIEFINELSQAADPTTLAPVNLIMLSNALPSHLQTINISETGLKKAQEQLRECLNGKPATTLPNISMISCLNLNCKVETIVRDMVSLVHDPQKNEQDLLGTIITFLYGNKTLFILFYFILLFRTARVWFTNSHFL